MTPNRSNFRPPPRPKGNRIGAKAASAQLPLLEAVPVLTRDDKPLYCPMCGGYRNHHPVTGTDCYQCRECGRKRKDNK